MGLMNRMLSDNNGTQDWKALAGCSFSRTLPDKYSSAVTSGDFLPECLVAEIVLFLLASLRCIPL